jgi:hypothetical protein
LKGRSGESSEKGNAMTEAEWLACTDPKPMLEFLRGKASNRKLRLFACACCRRQWPCLTDERSRNAVEVAERFADGLATDEDRKRASHAAQMAWDASLDAATPPVDSPETQAAVQVAIDAARFWVWNIEVAAGIVSDVLHKLAYVASVDVADACVKFVSQTPSKQVAGVELAAQASLLRCIINNPFHATKLDSSSRAPSILHLASVIHEERAFDRLPILADALEEAGCQNADILTHCRSSGPHVRGCWVIDLLLGKE